MSMGHPLGAPTGLYLCPWGALGRAPPCLARDPPWREAKLVSIKSASSRFSWFAVLPYRCHISHVRTPNNANSVSRLCATKLSSTLVFVSFLGNEDKISKLALEDNLLWFRTDCTAGILWAICPSSLIRIGPSTCLNQRYCRGPQRL
jgi:hypothetical protein